MRKFELINGCKLLLLLVTMTHAQRPSFAGARPANGLSQKDKYNHPQLAMGIAVETTTNNIQDIVNRFGSNTNNNEKLPQKPPVGIPVVYPETKYEPLPQNYTKTDSSDVGIANRFSAIADDNEVLMSKRPVTLPLDARGDEELVNQLSRLPAEKQPFWFLNYQAIEAQRQSPQVNGAQGTGGRSKFLG